MNNIIPPNPNTLHDQAGKVSALLLPFALLAILLNPAARADGWSTGAPMPTPRRAVAGAAVDGKLYVAGGINTANALTGALEVYDPAFDTWSSKQPMPSPQFHGGGVAVNGKFYVIGGHTGSSHLTTVRVYDPASNTWGSKSPMPVGLSSVRAALIGDKVYLEGDAFGGTYHFLIYDTATDIWTHKFSYPPGPPTNFGIASSADAIGGKFYAAGGQVSGQVNGLDVLRVYDPLADTWTLKAPMPSARTQGRGAAVSGRFYVIGGYQPGASGGGDRASVFEYDPVSNSWLTKTPMPSWREGSAVGVIGGKVYLASGANFTGVVADTIVYTPDTVAPPDDSDDCEAELTAAQQEIQSLQSQLASAEATIQNLTQSNQSLTIQNGLLQNQVNTLTAQNAQLQTANGQLTAQLNAANQTIHDQQGQIDSLTAQNAQLQAANAQLTTKLAAANQIILDQQNQIAQQQSQINSLTAQNTQLQSQLSNVGQQAQTLTQSLQALFNDPQFQIPGATPAEQIANLVTAIGSLNFGQKQALYLNLGGTKPGKGK